MNTQRHDGRQPKGSGESAWQMPNPEQAPALGPKADPRDRTEQAARSVMHPDSYDPEWRYYHGAWGG